MDRVQQKSRVYKLQKSLRSFRRYPSSEIAAKTCKLKTQVRRIERIAGYNIFNFYLGSEEVKRQNLQAETVLVHSWSPPDSHFEEINR